MCSTAQRGSGPEQRGLNRAGAGRGGGCRKKKKKKKGPVRLFSSPPVRGKTALLREQRSGFKTPVLLQRLTRRAGVCPALPEEMPDAPRMPPEAVAQVPPLVSPHSPLSPRDRWGAQGPVPARLSGMCLMCVNT